MITKFGIYAMPKDEYHADPCPTPSLSASMINDILKAPRLCWHKSRRLNPDWEPEEKQERFSIGTVSHIILLEPHEFTKQVVVIRGRTKDGKESPGYASADSKQQRDDAIAAGKTPILPDQLEEIHKARDEFFSSSFTRHAFAIGLFERSLFWKHPVHGFWCRARPDFMAITGNAYLCDYKATTNADPRQFGRHAYGLGYHRRAAWYLEGLEIVTGNKPIHYWFCNQEVKAPYLTSVCELDMAALEAGRDENLLAADMFARCLETGDWHGYRNQKAPDRDRAFRESLPTWALMEIDRRLGRDRLTWPTPRYSDEGEE